MNTDKERRTRCPGCRRESPVVGVHDRPPEPGALFYCVECGTLGAFREDLTLREASALEIVSFARWLHEMKAAGRGHERLTAGMCDPRPSGKRGEP